MLSMHADEAYVMRALQAGATGYMVKDAAGKELLKAIESVAAGQAYFSPAIERLMLDENVRRTPASGFADRYETLSAREREIFQLIAEAQEQQGSRGAARHQPGHRRDASRPDPAEARRPQHRRGGPLRGPARHHFLAYAYA